MSNEIFWFVRDGVASVWDEVTEADFQESALVYAETEEEALELAGMFDSRKLDYTDVVYKGGFVAAVRNYKS